MVTNIDIPISTTTLAGLLGSDTWLSFRGPGHSYVVSVARPFGSEVPKLLGEPLTPDRLMVFYMAIVIAVAAAEAVVGLSLILRVLRGGKGVDASALRELRG